MGRKIAVSLCQNFKKILGPIIISFVIFIFCNTTLVNWANLSGTDKASFHSLHFGKNRGLVEDA